MGQHNPRKSLRNPINFFQWMLNPNNRSKIPKNIVENNIKYPKMSKKNPGKSLKNPFKIPEIVQNP